MTATLRASSNGTQDAFHVKGVDSLVTASIQVSVPRAAVNGADTFDAGSVNIMYEG